MDLRQLEYVVAVAETLSFTRAAERCHVVQSALSHQIARLEAELDTRLFQRSSRAVRVTASGEVLVAHARRVLATVEDARAELGALEGLTRGRLAIGATQTAGRVLDVVALLGDYHRRHPEVRLTASSGPAAELAAEVRQGTLDLAFVATDGVGPALATRTLVAREPLVAVVGLDHPLARRRRVRLAELTAAGPFVEFRAGAGLRVQVDALFAAAGLTREVALELGRVSDLVRFVAQGFGTAIVPAAFARPPGEPVAPADGARPFATLQLAAPGAALTVRAVYRDGGSGPALRALLDLLAEERPRVRSPRAAAA